MWLELSQSPDRAGPAGIQVEGTLPAISNEHAQGPYGEAGAWLELLYNPLVTKDFVKVQGD